MENWNKTVPVMNENCNAVNREQAIKDFAMLIKKSQDDKNNESLRSIIVSLEKEIQCNDNYLVKMFLLNTQTGLMINSDNALNISFRVDTINMIFDNIVESLIKLDIPASKAEEVFFNAGNGCGLNFGQHFNNLLRMRVGGAVSAEQKIIEWCDFDSSVGWGKLSYNAQDKSIVIHNNFQANEYNTGGFPRSCSFFKGYICGVLERLVGMGHKVSLSGCESATCKKNTGCDEACVLKYKIEV